MRGWDSQAVQAAEARMAGRDKLKFVDSLYGQPQITLYEGHPSLTKQKPTMKLQPSTDEDKLNKTEKAYLQFLRSGGYAWIGIQSITLKLADDTRYTCDFFCLDEWGTLHGREVKGFFRDDAKVKIKVAARMFPFIKFTVVKRVAGGWEHKEVNP